jgi:uncharacterized protein
VLVGIVVCLVYGVILIGLQKLSRVPYTDFASSTSNMVKGALVPVAICATGLVVILAATGRLVEAFTYEPRSESVLLWSIPVVVLLGAVVRLWGTSWSTVGARFVLVALVTSAMVGFSEELLIRGYFVDVLQSQGISTIWIAIVSSILFGVIHGLNALNGQDAQTTLMQVAASTVLGLGLFAALAVSGTLWLPIAMHALFDFSLLARGKIVDKDQTNPLDVGLVAAMYLLSLGSLFLI